MKPIVDRAGRRVSAVVRRDGSGAGNSKSLQVDVVDARFAGLNTIHYLYKVLVFDL